MAEDGSNPAAIKRHFPFLALGAQALLAWATQWMDFLRGIGLGDRDWEPDARGIAAILGVLVALAMTLDNVFRGTDRIRKLARVFFLATIALIALCFGLKALIHFILTNPTSVDFFNNWIWFGTYVLMGTSLLAFVAAAGILLVKKI